MGGSPVIWPERISGFRSGVINALIDAVDSLRPVDTATVKHEWRSDGTAAHARRPPAASREFPFGPLYSFGLLPLTATTVKVYAGYLHIHGRGSYLASTATVTLSGATAYVYAEFARSAGTFAIAAASSASIPSTNSASHYRLPLYCLISEATSWYRLANVDDDGVAGVLHGGHDIHIGTAI